MKHFVLTKDFVESVNPKLDLDILDGLNKIYGSINWMNNWYENLSSLSSFPWYMNKTTELCFIKNVKR